MPADHDQFKRSLLRLLQTGTFQRFLGCGAHQTAAVEVRLERVYQIALNRRTIVVDELDLEEVRRKTQDAWRPLAPPNLHRNRIVLDRRTGRMLQAPGLGTLRRRASPRR